MYTVKLRLCSLNITGLITTIVIQIEFIAFLDLLMSITGDVNLGYKVA
jgi:hypothetical protein